MSDVIPPLAGEHQTAPLSRAALAERLADALTPLLRCERCLLAINDPQRHTDTPAVLHALGDAVSAVGASPRLELLVACGTHRFCPADRERFEARLRQAHESPPIDSIQWHDASSPALRPIGTENTWWGHPGLTEGDAPLLAIGSVEPHYFAGLTGAHKTATVGLASRNDIERNHAFALSDSAQPWALWGNPIFDGVAGMLAALQSHRPIVAVNLVQAGDAMVDVAVGEPIATVQELLPVARARFGRSIPSPADALVLEVTGPLGDSFYQADKAIKNNERAIRDGGTLVLVAPCGRGIGQDHFVSLLREAPTWKDAMDRVEQRGYRLGDHKAVRLRHLTDPAGRNVRVVAVSQGLSAGACEVLGFSKAPTVVEALARVGVQPGLDRVYRVPDAANMVVTAGSPVT